MGFGRDALEAFPVVPIPTMSASSVCAGRGPAKGRGDLLVVARVMKASERELGRALANAKKARVFDVAHRVEAAHLAVDEFHVRDASSAHRRSYQGLARAGSLERLGLRRGQTIQFGIDAGEAVANVAKDPEFPLARIANVRARVAVHCKTRDPFRRRAQIRSGLPEAALGRKWRGELAGCRDVRSNKPPFRDEELLGSGELGQSLSLRGRLQAARSRSGVSE